MMYSRIALGALLVGAAVFVSGCGPGGGGGGAGAGAAGAGGAGAGGAAGTGAGVGGAGGAAGAGAAGAGFGGSVDWTLFTAADEQAGKQVAYGIARIIDLERYEDVGWDIIRFTPGAGPEDRLGFSYATVVIDGQEITVNESRWMALYDLVEARQMNDPTGYIIETMPDSRYDDGERTKRGDLVFAFVVEDEDEKSIKVVWQRQ